MNTLQVTEFCNRVFEKYDKNKSGFIEIDELTTLLNNLAKEINSQLPTQKEIDYILTYLDTNNDKKISRSEFQKLGQLMVKILANFVKITNEIQNFNFSFNNKSWCQLQYQIKDSHFINNKIMNQQFKKLYFIKKSKKGLQNKDNFNKKQSMHQSSYELQKGRLTVSPLIQID
ncbi:unnamed protein product [Paramecium primaurelia]|uniref:EF-hand domain-containing protein n=1 Tax=Paramecium primaurelia TaxID=5886 RepID=A0A8S1JY95_PARPR|nr:unnamed protein product [Paramecium primaurelia]